jgi:hypothetical protein
LNSQDVGFININGHKILLLRRRTTASGGYTQLMLRVSGGDGQHFENIEEFLSDNQKFLSLLNEGKTVTI